MDKARISIKNIKKELLEFLKDKNFKKNLNNLTDMQARKVVNPLFSFFYNKDELIKWHAVTAMGVVVSNLAGQEIESARIIMRRLLWNLNDESGGIGWGSPEAMGEIMSRNSKIADEYHRILVSYIMEHGNFIEHELLQRGVLWGIGRLAQKRQKLVSQYSKFLVPYMQSNDAFLRGLAVWAAGSAGNECVKNDVKRLLDDTDTLLIYLNEELIQTRVMDLAKQAFERL